MANDWLNTLGLDTTASRMPDTANPDTIGPEFFTADQADMRANAVGYDGDPAGAEGVPKGHSNVTRTIRHPDGTCDIVKLETTSDGWIDTGGATPKDIKVVNW